MASDTRNWDVIVVGAGAVGIVLAVVLGRAGKRVLLIESGGWTPSERALALNEAEQTGRLHSGITNGRARVVGGTTTLWGGQLTYFSRSDFETKDDAGEPNWPIRFDDLENFYREAAALLGLDTQFLDDERVRQSIKAKKVSDQNCSIFYTRWLTESNFSRLFRHELENSENIKLVSDSQVIGFGLSEALDTISHVEVSGPGGSRQTFSSDVVILANGTIEISRSLLLAGRQHPTAAWAGNENIGAYFQDHLDLVVGRINRRDVKKVANAFENAVIAGKKYQPKIRASDTGSKDDIGLNVAASLQFESNFSEDIEMFKKMIRNIRTGQGMGGFGWNNWLGLLVQIRVWYPLAWRYIRHRRIGAIADAGISVMAHAEQKPLRDSRVSLSQKSVDAFGLPLASLDWKIDVESQVKAFRVFSDRLKSFFVDEFGATLEIAPKLHTDVGFLDKASDSYHQCGGAKMARSPRTGVVDADCKVHGTKNLFIAGAAVFPSSSFANPTFTAIALALRLAARLQLSPAPATTSTAPVTTDH
jgi:choline dehydrogenase-like flavoprotein